MNSWPLSTLASLQTVSFPAFRRAGLVPLRAWLGWGFSLGLGWSRHPAASARPQFLQAGSPGLELGFHHLGGLGRPGNLSEPHFPHLQRGYNHINLSRCWRGREESMRKCTWSSKCSKCTEQVTASQFGLSAFPPTPSPSCQGIPGMEAVRSLEGAKGLSPACRMGLLEAGTAWAPLGERLRVGQGLSLESAETCPLCCVCEVTTSTSWKRVTESEGGGCSLHPPWCP